MTGSAAYQLSVLTLIVALELPPEGDRGQPQDFGRLCSVAAAGPEDLLVVLRLQLLERAERLRPRRRGRRWAVPQIRRQVRESDRLAGLREDHGPLDGVPQLADVPRPLVAREDLEDVRREAVHRLLLLPAVGPHERGRGGGGG